MEREKKNENENSVADRNKEPRSALAKYKKKEVAFMLSGHIMEKSNLSPREELYTGRTYRNVILPYFPSNKV